MICQIVSLTPSVLLQDLSPAATFVGVHLTISHVEVEQPPPLLPLAIELRCSASPDIFSPSGLLIQPITAAC
jgi:hypothetical protein